jgi:hypothetical protein
MDVRFVVLTEANVLGRDVTSVVGPEHHRFGGTKTLHLQDMDFVDVLVYPENEGSSFLQKVINRIINYKTKLHTLKMEVVSSFEMLITIYQAILHSIFPPRRMKQEVIPKRC